MYLLFYSGEEKLPFWSRNRQMECLGNIFLALKQKEKKNQLHMIQDLNRHLSDLRTYRFVEIQRWAAPMYFCLNKAQNVYVVLTLTVSMNKQVNQFKINLQLHSCV